MPEGYSGTPLIKKLGIKSNFKVAIVNAPDHYFDLLGELPDEVDVQTSLQDNDYNFVHAFYVQRSDYETDFDMLKAAIKKDGMVWISWYKKASKMPTDITEDVVRDVALVGGLVDVKVAAIDKQWSGLKLVFRKADR